MKFLIPFSVAIFSTLSAFSQDAAVSALNQYAAFADHSVAVVIDRFEMLVRYQEQVEFYEKHPSNGLRLTSSGPLEEFYYNKAREGKSLTISEKQKLNNGTDSLWAILNELDETCKALETYVRLGSYKSDHFRESDNLMKILTPLFTKFREEKTKYYKQIQQVHKRYVEADGRDGIYSGTNPYIETAKEMERAIVAQQQLLDSLPYYPDPATRSAWPVALLEKSLIAGEKLLATFGESAPRLPYPASSVIPDFKAGLQSMQDIKRRAIDGNNFEARQSAAHGNAVYMSLLKQLNQDLIAWQKSFTNYSKPASYLLIYPTYSPVFSSANTAQNSASGNTLPFEDQPVVALNIKKANAPAPAATVSLLNEHINFINEGLRQMNLLQQLVRNYQSSAEYYRDPARAVKRAGLEYAHADFELPLSAYQLLKSRYQAIPTAYRNAISTQTAVLMDILKEMDGLSIELIRYTAEKQYLADQLKRSDAILDRYATLFEIFDLKKEQLYNDIRRVHESFPNVNPASSWYVSGKSLLETLDADKAVLFGVKSFYRGETDQLPPTEAIEAGAKQLIADEYKNLKGLKRYGRSNRLCPYSPYEDLAANSIRLAEKTRTVKPLTPNFTTHPYDSFYYFYNNELVYQYNKFVTLANLGLLKAVNQPNLSAFPNRTVAVGKRPDLQQSVSTNIVTSAPESATKSVQETKPVENPGSQIDLSKNGTHIAQTDTVYVERLRVDTVFVDRNAALANVTRSLEGFAANNMVLLLDVSSSMNSPAKMPLLKRAIKSLLTILRPQDQITIVLYSGKARVVLKPTSGEKAAEIARMIDLLKSDGDTDGNEGLRLAYKSANKSYIRGGNNRIVLATDGEFPVSGEVMEMIGQNARQDLFLSVFTFGKNAHAGQKLRKLSETGQGTYAHITEESADLQLILEAQAKRQ